MTKPMKLSDDAFNAWAKCSELLENIETYAEKDCKKGALEEAERLVIEAQYLRDTIKKMEAPTA